MRKWYVTALAVGISLASLGADVTVVQTVTMEGPAAAAMGGVTPRTTTRFKGMKARVDIEAGAQTVSSIIDLAGRQVIMLNAATKTAVVTSVASAAGAAPGVAPTVDVSFKPTGKTQTIDGQLCEEHKLVMALAMIEILGDQAPPEAAAALKDVKMTMDGSIWVARSAPGAAEFAAFNKAAADAKLLSAVGGLPPGQSGGLDKLMEAVAGGPGLPYLAEISMTIDGTGPMIELLKQMGGSKMIQKIASVSTEAISDDLFKVPADYTTEKK